MIASTAAAADVKDDEAARALVEQLEQAASTGDSSRLAPLLADDVRWTVHASRAAVPFAGAYRGVDGVIGYYQQRARHAVLEPAASAEVDSTPDRILVRRALRGSVPITGGFFETESLTVLDLEQGRIRSANEYLDSQAVADAFVPADGERGQAWFTTCAGCHGNAGEGRVALNAPNLTGQSGAYLVRQLRHFASEVRGGVTDPYGWQMNGRAKSLPGDRAWRDVVAYIETLPSVRPAKTADLVVPGVRKAPNVDRGKVAYNACIACHGESAEGVPAVDGPALTPLDDWYLVRQLQAFKSGTRGNNSADTPGQQMRASVATLSDADIADIVAYLSSLP